MVKRRYPAPWKMQENDESYVVTDALGQPLAYVYFEDEPQRQVSTKRIRQGDAYQLAHAIKRIPERLRRD
jgi:hypothetical protein